MSSLRWRKGRNSSLCNHWAGEKEEIFEIRVYVVIELEKRKKFKFMSSMEERKKFEFILSLSWRKGRNFRNSNLDHHWAGEKEGIQVYIVTGEKEERNFRNSSFYHHWTIIEKKEISEIRFSVIKKFLKFSFISSGFSFCWRKGRNFRNSILCRHWGGGKEGIRVYVIIELEKRKEFSKFEFMSSLSWRKRKEFKFMSSLEKRKKFEFISSSS